MPVLGVRAIGDRLSMAVRVRHASRVRRDAAGEV